MVLWLKALHIVAVISWMAGLLYLPRLFVYHAEAARDGAEARMLQVMERRLLRFIMTPAMLVVWISGPLLAVLMGYHRDGWFIAKMVFVVALSAAHGQMGRWRRELADGSRTRSSRFFRFANEIPTVLMLIIVVLVVVKPF